jgi:cyclophilin family peptidyl-prolyl cis-trans isomerase
VVLLPAAAPAQPPRLSDERVVLHTVGGDVVIALFPDDAPEHTAQIINLARLGVYDHTRFHRVESGFVLQLADVSLREEEYALTPGQVKAIHAIRAEFSPTLKHRRGTVSMARFDGQPDSATTSFSILLGDAPHLDGQYTIFGEVIFGMDAVDKLVQVPPLLIDARTPPSPLVPLVINKAEVVAANDLDTDNLERAHDVRVPRELVENAHREAWALHRATLQQPGVSLPDDVQMAYLLTGGLLMMILLSLAAFFGSGRLSRRWLIALNMLSVLIGGFLLLAVLTPYARAYALDHKPLLAVLVFVSFFGIFKLLSRFESVG